MSQPGGKYRQTDRESKQNYCIVLYWCSNPGWVLLSVIITTMPVPLCIIIAAISAGTSVRASLIIYQWDTLDARKGPDGCRDFDVCFVVLSGSQCASVPVVSLGLCHHCVNNPPDCLICLANDWGCPICQHHISSLQAAPPLHYSQSPVPSP